MYSLYFINVGMIRKENTRRVLQKPANETFTMK